MLLAWVNRADDADLSTDSEIATLPASNVQQVHVARKWHTAAGVKSAYLIFDLGSALACAIAAVLGTNLTSAATIQIRASDSDSSVTSSLLYDSGSIAAGVDDDYAAIYKSFASQAARYWRIDLADAALPDNLQVGRVFIGPTWEPSIDIELGWSISSKDESRIEKSYAGQAYPDTRPACRVLEFSLAFMEAAEMFGSGFALSRAAGTTGDVLAVPDISSSYLSEQAVFGLLTASAPLVNYELGIYRQKFSIEERL